MTTREELIHAAREDLRAADSIGANYEYRTMRYAGAIAKLLLAQVTPDAPASPGPRFTEIMPRQDWEGR